MEFMVVSGSNTTEGIFGARNNANTRNFSVIKSSTDSIVIDVNNGDYSTYRVNSGQSSINKRCSVHVERTYKSVSYDGVLIASSTVASMVFSTSSTAFIFGTRTISYNVSARLYSLKWYRNGSPLFDLVPVRIGQVGYMYDKVSKQLFGNAGTGDFVLGNDID